MRQASIGFALNYFAQCVPQHADSSEYQIPQSFIDLSSGYKC